MGNNMYLGCELGTLVGYWKDGKQRHPTEIAPIAYSTIVSFLISDSLIIVFLGAYVYQMDVTLMKPIRQKYSILGL